MPVTMRPLFQTVTDLHQQADDLRARRYGVVEVVDGRMVAVRLRPFPKLITLGEIIPVGPRYHLRGLSDRCLLYYNQPWQFPNFLAVKYLISTRHTRAATVFTALAVLDAIAQIKGTDALLCDVANSRISDRLLRRGGWEPHKTQRWHRNFIKRFYGEYPTAAQHLGNRSRDTITASTTC